MQESGGTQHEQSGQASGGAGEAGAMASRPLESMVDVRREAEHLSTVGVQGGGTAEARSGGAHAGTGGPSQAATSVQDILAEWEDLSSPGPEGGVWTQEQSGASPEQAMALAEGARGPIPAAMATYNRLHGSIPHLISFCAHGARLLAAPELTGYRRKSVAGAQARMRATHFIILSPLGQPLGILAVAWAARERSVGARLVVFLKDDLGLNVRPPTLDRHPECVCVKADAKNAFNAAHRDAMFKAIQQEFPEGSAPTDACDGVEADLGFR
ncbi:hypothetical protein CYMTET_32975 [Cymbomonas tetramitiformis]|uniref:Uncharacterized protein n=1 Tax=Cymbomonas tetramitiformis TaxID=36881 RepID=A0AAE0KRB4_9CHLO|nr:hypothetical protein CYMTET_32975 [Cymbomonas tetramitiformis]